MIMQRAMYVADNGTEFTFLYSAPRRKIRVYIGSTLHMTIVDVEPEDSTKEMNSFMEIWNQANPKRG